MTSSKSLEDEEAKDALTPLQPILAASFSPPQEVKNLDEFIGFGKYTVLVLWVAEFLCLATLSNMIYMVYAGADPTVIGCGDVIFNSTYKACTLLKEMRNATGCTPVLESQFHSVNIEFDYLCDGKTIVKHSISLQMTAVLIGAFVFGQLSDIYGRKIVLLFSLAGGGVFSVATCYVQNFFYFNIFRIISGFFGGGVSAVQGVFLVENVPRKHRMLINTVITWSPNFVIYPIIAYYCEDWRTLTIAGGVVNALAFVSLSFCFESPRFVIQKGRIEKARKIISSIRRYHGDDCAMRSAEIERMLAHEQEVFSHRKAKQHTFYHLLNKFSIAKCTITLCFGIMITSIVNYGILFNMEKLSGSLYLNNVMFGIIRWTMNITVGVLDYNIDWMGRKTINFVSEMFNAICVALIIAIQLTGHTTAWAQFVRVASIAVSAMCAQVYLAKFMTTTEFYPTAVRNLGASALSMSSRVGTILGPQIFNIPGAHESIPYILTLALIVVDLIAFELVLPETKGLHLENHLPSKKRSRKPSMVDRRPSLAD